MLSFHLPDWGDPSPANPRRAPWTSTKAGLCIRNIKKNKKEIKLKIIHIKNTINLNNNSTTFYQLLRYILRGVCRAMRLVV